MRTETPLQALILLNGVQYVEAARVLGQQAYAEAKGDAARMVEIVFLRCLSRKPDAKETGNCHAALPRTERSISPRIPARRKQFLKVGRAPCDANIPPADLAAAAVLGQALLNHDECVVKR